MAHAVLAQEAVAETATPPYAIDAEGVIESLGSDRTHGLSSEEASNRLARLGPNELTEAPPVPKWKKRGPSLAGPRSTIPPTTRSSEASVCRSYVMETDLQKRVELFLARAPIRALQGVQVTAQHDTVILTGTVNTFYAKQMAQEFAKRVAGVVGIVNRIEVRDVSQRQSR